MVQHSTNLTSIMVMYTIQFLIQVDKMAETELEDASIMREKKRMKKNKVTSHLRTHIEGCTTSSLEMENEVLKTIYLD